MPSASKPQAALMAAAAHNPMIAKRRGIPMRVAREFNQADRRQGVVRKGLGGLLKSIHKKREETYGKAWTAPKATAGTPTATPDTAPKVGTRRQVIFSPEEYLNYGMGPQRDFYQSTAAAPATPGAPAPAGQGRVSIPRNPARPTQGALAPTDQAIGLAMQQLAKLGMGRMLADGGKVEAAKPAKKPLSKAAKDAIVKRENEDRALAVQALRDQRDQLEDDGMAEGGPVEGEAEDPAMQGMAPEEGGAAELGQDADPAMLYQEFQQLLQRLESGELEQAQAMQVVERLQQIEEALGALGVETPGSAQ